MSSPAELGMAALTVVMASVLSLGVARSARADGRPRAFRLAATVAVALALWLSATALLARSGALSAWTSLPPRLPLVPLTAFAAALLVSRTSRTRALIAAVPGWWPIAAQSFRVGVELALFAFHAQGEAPRHVTFEGRNFDVFVGLTAPIVAWLVARQRATPVVVVVWNVLGLAVLANTVGTVITSVPGPIHIDWPGEPFTALATWPLVWLPAFLAPLAVFLHVVSLRQALPLLRGSRATPTT